MKTNHAPNRRRWAVLLSVLILSHLILSRFDCILETSYGFFAQPDHSYRQMTGILTILLWLAALLPDILPACRRKLAALVLSLLALAAELVIFPLERMISRYMTDYSCALRLTAIGWACLLVGLSAVAMQIVFACRCSRAFRAERASEREPPLPMEALQRSAELEPTIREEADRTLRD